MDMILLCLTLLCYCLCTDSFVFVSANNVTTMTNSTTTGSSMLILGTTKIEANETHFLINGTDILYDLNYLSAKVEQLEGQLLQVLTVNLQQTALITALESNTASLNATLELLMVNSSTSSVFLNYTIQALESDVDALQVSVSSAETDISTLQADVTSIDTDLTTAEGNIVTLQSEMNTVEALAASHTTDLTAAEGNIVTLQSEMNTVEALAASHTTDLTAAEGNIVTLQSEMNTVEALAASHTTDLTAAEGNIVTLQSEMNTVEALAASHTTDLTAAEGNIVTLQSEMNTVEALAASHTTDVTTAEGDIVSLESAVAALTVVVDGKVGQETTTKNIYLTATTHPTAAHIQAEIDALDKYIARDVVIALHFTGVDQVYAMNNQILIDGFMGSGTLQLLGNDDGVPNTARTTQTTVFDYATMPATNRHALICRHNSIIVDIKYIKFVVPGSSGTSATDRTIIMGWGSNSLRVYYNYLQLSNDNSYSRCIYVQEGNMDVRGNILEGGWDGLHSGVLGRIFSSTTTESAALAPVTGGKTNGGQILYGTSRVLGSLYDQENISGGQSTGSNAIILSATTAGTA